MPALMSANDLKQTHLRDRPEARLIIELMFAFGFPVYLGTKIIRDAALIFAIVSVLQLVRALGGWPVTVGGTVSIPLWESWTACVVAAVLA
jgi:hypothetical protein